MGDFVIFPDEQEIADLIRASSKIAYAVAVEPRASLPVPDPKLQGGIATNLGQFDLYYFKTLLASTGWNLNDDVFDPVETWQARGTPADKPINEEHKPLDILGHMTDSFVIDTDGAVLPDDSKVEDLPEKFHVCDVGVLYRYSSDADRQVRIDEIIDEIESDKNPWFVSMECLFHAFDYSLISATGKQTTVIRSPETAYLTKHLRAYGGTGKYQGSRVGRLMRNFTFSGKGLVKKPANPESIIFPEENTPATAAAGYPITCDLTQETTVADEALLKQLADAKAEIEQLRTNDYKKLKADYDDAVAAKQTAIDHLNDMKKKHDDMVDSHAKMQKDMTSMGESLVEHKAKLANIEEKACTTARIHLVSKKLGMDEAKATEFTATLVSLDEAAFAASVDYMATKMAEYKAAVPSTVAASPPPQSTPASAPNLTAPHLVKSVPTAGMTKPPQPPTNVQDNIITTRTESAKVDVDADPGEVNANPAILANATPVPDVSLNSPTNTGERTEQLRASVSEFLTGHYVGVKKSKKTK